MKKLISFFIVVLLHFSTLQVYAGDVPQLDLNRASFSEIQALPVTPEAALYIYEWVIYRGGFNSVYELQQVPGLDIETFLKLKPLVKILPAGQLTGLQEKIEQIYFRLDRWSSGEGVNDALIDLWIERAFDPVNVNNASYNDLINLQNVSPVDAAALIRHRSRVHWIRDERDLRNVPDFSGYAWRSARYLLDYQDVENTRPLWHGNLLMRIDNTPFMADEGEQVQQAGLTAATTAFESGYNLQPNMYYKGQLKYGSHLKFGASWFRNIGEPNQTDKVFGLKLPDAKYFVTLQDLKFGALNLDQLVVGNYSATFGQGVVMESTDFYTPRRTGYGIRKRFSGISPDLSRTREFTLNGIAAEASLAGFSAAGFVSFDDRDAILNKQIYDTSAGRGFNQLVLLDQRFNYALDDVSRSNAAGGLDLSWLNSVKELTYGGHLQYDFLPGTYLGATFYESAYDRPIEPYAEEIVNSGDMDRLVTADTEILQAYGGAISRGTNPFWSEAVSFRRVYGFDFQAVIRNLVLQGEYGELDKGETPFISAANPSAMVLSAYLQFSNFNLLGLYRHYDIAFDNPYQRSFSNYHRFKGTIFEDYYYLQSALYGQLYENSAQPQAEEGYYMEMFYQVNRQLNTRLQYDTWQRLADRADQYRIVGTVDYSPVFPLSIQVRQKIQSRAENNALTPNLFYKNYEFRGRVRARLSGYDDLTLMYATSKLVVHPRPRVFGDILLDGEAMTAEYTHNFNTHLKMSGMVGYYKGFLWNFEDTQFVVMESTRGAFRYWLALYSRLDTQLSMRFKYTADFHKPVSDIAFDPSSATLRENSGKFFAAPWNRSIGHQFFTELIYNF